MATVLVTGVGGPTGIGAIRSLRERTDHELIGVDMDPTAAGLHLADAGHTVPPADDDAWAEALCSVVADHDVDAIVPTVDEELAALPSLYEALPSGVPVVAPSLDTIDVALDKYRTYHRLANAGHVVPETWLATERDGIDRSAFPLLVKPRCGRGSRGVERVDDPTELSAHLAATDRDPAELLVQEFLTGTEYTTSVVTTRDDRLLGVVPKEAVRKEGSTVTGVTRRCGSVEESCRAIHDTLRPRGPINVQQIVDDGVAYTIEINPRFSSTSCLTAAAGVDEFDLLVRDALGESVTAPSSFEADLYIRRYHDHVFVPGEAFERGENG